MNRTHVLGLVAASVFAAATLAQEEARALPRTPFTGLIIERGLLRALEWTR